MSAILFGSISTVADTSELQREAFNQAFDEHGLGWRWDREQYVEMLGGNGGANRIAEFARSTGQDVDAGAVHRTKSERFRRLLRQSAPPPREGVAATIAAARAGGTAVALVTTTSPENVAALVEVLTPHLGDAPFDLLVDAGQVEKPKPDPEAYRYALSRLGLAARECVAIEDNVGGVEAARAAGVTVVAFPNANTAGHDFGAADGRVTALDPSGLRARAGDDA